ncbi:MAG: 5'/3'-nucleotidase SurE [Myxococcota bacterium]|nr:5'/3'-nucleotidase SurE [Myxococcota bacterium]
MLVLLTNDDGVDAPGIASLAEHLAPLGEIIVAAPAAEQSAKSHALTMHTPLRVEGRGSGWFSVSGTPADCVYLGMHHLCDRRPDVVVSGINRGTNLGEDVYYSGTVAGAREAVMQGVPGLAVSLDTSAPGDDRSRNWETAAMLARQVVMMMLDHGDAERTVLNLNVPDVPPDRLTRLHVTRVGRRRYRPAVTVRQDPRGRGYYWIGGEHESFCDEPETDGHWHTRGHPTLSPLRIDPSATDMVDVISRWRARR